MEKIMQAISTLDEVAALATLAFIVLDVFSGMMKGAAEHNLSSKIMRRGFWHKASLVLTLVVAGTIDTATTLGLHIGFDAPIFEAVCIYICFMELVSILENIAAVNPDLKGSKIFKLLDHGKKEEYREEQQES